MFDKRLRSLGKLNCPVGKWIESLGNRPWIPQKKCDSVLSSLSLSHSAWTNWNSDFSWACIHTTPHHHTLAQSQTLLPRLPYYISQRERYSTFALLQQEITGQFVLCLFLRCWVFHSLSSVCMCVCVECEHPVGIVIFSRNECSLRL